MRQLVSILTGFLLVGGLATPASGRPEAVITLPQHGTVSLVGSHVRCGSATVNGLIYINCGIAGPGNEPKKGGYVAVMLQDGRVTILNSTTGGVVFSRAPASAWAGTPVRPGDSIVLPKTSISCNASRVGGKPTIICYYLDKKGVVRPGSVSFGISDTVVTSLGWNQSRQVKLLRSWPQNG